MDQFRLGTEGYRSPELLSDDPSFTNKSDIWALGCVVFELVSGTSLFRSDFHTREYAISGSAKGDMRVAIDRYVSGFDLNSEDRDWMSMRLVSTVSSDPTARPTASELKSVFHTMLNAIPEGQRHSRM